MNDNTFVRQSQFELLRILAQFFIVTYHILLVFVYPTTGESIYKALWLPFHIGVLLFILISGYFGIKPSVKGLIKLLGIVIVLSVPLEIVNICKNGGGIDRLSKFH